MTDAIAEVEELNPHFRWDGRKQKRRVKSLAKKLIPNVTYAMGCRGHPGLVVKKDYEPDWPVGHLMGADVEIKSLIDGIEESCSIYHCVPTLITREYAERRAEYAKTHHCLDVSVEFDGWDAEEIRRDYWDNWIKEGITWYVLWDKDGQVVRSTSAMTLDSARSEIERMDKVFPGCNPRKVDMRTYPGAPTLLGL